MTALTERGQQLRAPSTGGSSLGEDRDRSPDQPDETGSVPRSVNALDACHAARQAWQRTQPQYAIDLWGDSPDHVEGHSRTTGGLAASRAGNGKRTPAALDYPDALNARPGPETARGPHAPISPPGSSVEGAGGVLVRAVGNGGNPASSLTNQGERPAPPTRRKRGVGRK